MYPVSSINVNTVDIYTETWAKYFEHRAPIQREDNENIKNM